MMDDRGKQAILYLCYQAVRVVGPRYNSYDSMAQANLAEALADKIAEFISQQPNNEMVCFDTADADTYDYLCDIFDTIQQTLPIMCRFNVRLHMERVEVEKETHDTATANRHKRGGIKDLGR